MLNLDTLTEDQITQSLKKETDKTFDVPHHFKETQYRKASVLIPFVRIEDTWHIVFIRRAESDKDRHSGQVAFVGGKEEAEDRTVIDTALRETHEEIGVNPGDVKILGQLGFHYSVSRFEITPVVATIPWPYDLTLDPAEVSRAFTLPLTWLAEESNYEIRNRQPPESDQQVPVVFFNKHDGELLWGATARMILSLVNTLKET